MAHRREHAFNALPFPICHHSSPLPSPSAKHQPTCKTMDHVSRAVSVYFPSFCWVLIRKPTEGWLRLSRPGCLVLCRGGLPIHRRSPIRH